jgi:hypothetical protein
MLSLKISNAPLIAAELLKDKKVWNLAASLIQFCNMISSFNFLFEHLFCD